MTSSRFDARHLPRFLFFFALSGLCESFAVAAFMSGQIAGNPSFVLHLAAALAAFLSVKRGRAGLFYPGRLWGRTSAFFVFFLPVFGWFCAACVFFFYRPISQVADFENEDDAGDFQVDEKDLPLAVGISIEDRIHHQLDFMPLADVLAGDDLALKRGAIDNLAKIASPEAISLLLSKRGDASPEVRFFATSALTRVKREMDDELEAAKGPVQSGKQDGVARVALARAYMRLAKSGVLDEPTARVYFGEAAHHAERASKDSPDALRLLAACHLARGEWDAALAAADAMASVGHDPLGAIKCRIEVCYAAGRYDGVVAGLKRWRETGKQDAAWTAAVYLWGAA